MRIFHVNFIITPHNGDWYFTSWTFKEENMTTKYPTPKMISRWKETVRGNSGYCHFFSYVELSEDEE